MASTPVEDHTEEFEQLAGLSALGALEGDELARFERHRAGCERCQLLVRLDREVLRRLAPAAPEMDPSPGFKDRLMERAASELAAEASAEPRAAAEPIPLRRAGPANVIPFWRRSRWVGVLAAVLVVALASAGVFGYENQAIASVDLQGSAAGTATVVVRRSGSAELQMRGVPDPDPGFVYEAWIIPPGQAPIAAGVANSGSATLSLGGDPRGKIVAVTRERSRVDAPTSEPILAGPVQS